MQRPDEDMDALVSHSSTYFLEPGSLTELDQQPTGPRGPPVSASSYSPGAAGVHTVSPIFRLGARGLNLGPPACEASAITHWDSPLHLHVPFLKYPNGKDEVESPCLHSGYSKVTSFLHMSLNAPN